MTIMNVYNIGVENAFAALGDEEFENDTLSPDEERGELILDQAQAKALKASKLPASEQRTKQPNVTTKAKRAPGSAKARPQSGPNASQPTKSGTPDKEGFQHVSPLAEEAGEQVDPGSDFAARRLNRLAKGKTGETFRKARRKPVGDGEHRNLDKISFHSMRGDGHLHKKSGAGPFNWGTAEDIGGEPAAEAAAVNSDAAGTPAARGSQQNNRPAVREPRSKRAQLSSFRRDPAGSGERRAASEDAGTEEKADSADNEPKQLTYGEFMRLQEETKKKLLKDNEGVVTKTTTASPEVESKPLDLEGFVPHKKEVAVPSGNYQMKPVPSSTTSKTTKKGNQVMDISEWANSLGGKVYFPTPSRPSGVNGGRRPLQQQNRGSGERRRPPQGVGRTTTPPSQEPKHQQATVNIEDTQAFPPLGA